MPINLMYPTEGPDVLENGILFRNTNLSGGALFKVSIVLKEGDSVLSTDEWQGSTMRFILPSLTVIDFPDRETRDREIALWRSLYIHDQSDSKFKIPRVCADFEFENKAYAILAANFPQDGETNSITYKNVILNPEGYLASREGADAVSGQVHDRLQPIV